MTEAIPPGTRYHINAFYFTGCGLQRRRLCCRVTVNNTRVCDLSRTALDQCVAFVAQSDKVTHNHYTAPCPCFRGSGVHSRI
ncbi:hypothetical protein JS561_03890 [Salmonella enterica subsp. enterica serovar Infantis]|nr:hypothetical protein JS561_03890 [Salmonella enterica subsp. enterica serovar Infantis]